MNYILQETKVVENIYKIKFVKVWGTPRTHRKIVREILLHHFIKSALIIKIQHVSRYMYLNFIIEKYWIF
ncbi:hypothetical protein BWZ22_11345 [Seonamhaeicola sp. S2-3]|nr:hypothetical protein BWZ22_11345 [Seonamhaeicola sp. S2-3]